MITRILLLHLIALSFVACNTATKKPDAIAVQRNGVPISYTECGEGDTTLLFVHGWCINKEYWESQVKHFCPRYKVVAIDLPGFGQSGSIGNDWSFADYALDVKAVIDQLKLKNVILIGHSMSGDIVLKADNEFPKDLAGIIGIDNLHEPGSVMNEAEQKQTATMFDTLKKAFDSTVSKYMRPSLFQPTTDSSIVNRVMNNVFTTDSVVATRVIISLTGIAQQEKPMMQNLAHKLYLINSDVVPVKADSLNKYCSKGFELVTVHATGHYPMLEKPDEFNAALEKVLGKIREGK